MPDTQMPVTPSEALQLLNHLQHEADRRCRIHARRTRIAGGSLVSAIAVALAVGTVHLVRTSEPPPPSTTTINTPTKTQGGSAVPSQPIYGLGTKAATLPWHPRLDSFGGPLDKQARSVSLAAAQRMAGFPVAVPSGSTLARPARIKKVWFLPLTADGENANVVSIEYPNLEIVQQRMPTTYNGPRAYAGMVNEHADPRDFTQRLNSTTAYVAPAYTDSHGMKHPGYVQYTTDHIQTTIEGYYPTATLTDIAYSMAP